MRNRNKVRLSSEGFSFHTIELKAQMHDAEFDKLFHHLKTISKEKELYRIEYDNECWFCGHFFKQGIRIFLTRLKDTNAVKLVINPRLLIDPRAGYLGIMLTDEESLDYMQDRFTEIMRKAHLPEQMDDWTLSRIDLCVNFFFDRKKQPHQIIKLLNRGPVAKGYERKTYRTLSDSGNDKLDLDSHSIKLSNQSVALVAYDKAYQIMRENLAIPEEKITRGILRLELQCRRDWIAEIAKKHKLHDTVDQVRFLASHSQQFICKYAEKLFPRGEYCKVEILQGRIQRSDLSEKSKDRMIIFLSLFDRYDTFDEVLDVVSEQLSDRQLRTLFEGFEELNLCPVPLGEKSKLSSITSIPSLLQQLAEDDSLDISYRVSKKKKIIKSCCTSLVDE